MNNLALPNQLLKSIDKKLPTIWRDIDEFRNDQKPDWHPAVFMPLVLWQKFFRMRFPGMEDIGRIGLTHVISSLGAWRPTQDIIRFDNGIYNALTKAPFKGKMPASVLDKLPAWGVYIESPDILIANKLWQGFFVSLEVFQNPELKLLRFLFLSADMMTYHYVIPLKDWTLWQAIAIVNSHIYKKYGIAARDHAQKVEAGVFQALNLLIYMCAYGFNGSKDSFHPISRAFQFKHNPIGWRSFAADKPAIHDISKELNSITKKGIAHNSDNRNSPKPHIRRGHLHAYWRGSTRKGNRKLCLRWIAPIPIAMKDDKRKDCQNEI